MRNNTRFLENCQKRQSFRMYRLSRIPKISGESEGNIAPEHSCYELLIFLMKARASIKIYSASNQGRLHCQNPAMKPGHYIQGPASIQQWYEFARLLFEAGFFIQGSFYSRKYGISFDYSFLSTTSAPRNWLLHFFGGNGPYRDQDRPEDIVLSSYKYMASIFGTVFVWVPLLFARYLTICPRPLGDEVLSSGQLFPNEVSYNAPPLMKASSHQQTWVGGAAKCRVISGRRLKFGFPILEWTRLST